MLRIGLVAILLALPGAAGAVELGLDLDTSYVTNSKFGRNPGLGASLRLGQGVALNGNLQLEIGGALTGMGGTSTGLIVQDNLGGQLYQAFAGLRWRTGAFFRPGFYVHGGYAWATGEQFQDLSTGGGDGSFVEAGILAELAFSRFSPGIHVAYRSFVGSSFFDRQNVGSDLVILQDFDPQMVELGIQCSLSL